MKYSRLFLQRLNCRNENEVFNYLIDNLKETIIDWDYFVEWGKVMSKVKGIETSLCLLNGIVEEENISENFSELISKHPEVVSILPKLLGFREQNVKILEHSNSSVFNYKEYSFQEKSSYTSEEISSFVEFVDKTGLLLMLKNKNIKSMLDYVIGVEVGLNTNARKNRSGKAMEKITELLVEKICTQNDCVYIKQANSNKIKQLWGYEVNVDKSDRLFDFAISGKNKLYLIETNYYGTSGSKLKAVAGEFTNLYRFLKEVNPQHTFIWITDGLGWKKTQKPLREAFDTIDYILNLAMLEKGILEDIIVTNS